MMAAGALLSPSVSWAQPTTITVHVLSKGAKFIGTSMGGALITVKDARTGELLAKGVTAGGTGDTGRIMKTPHTRGGVLSTPDAAKFETALDLEQPRLLEVTAYGPAAQPQSSNRVSATQWVVPGRDVTGGDAWLLEIPGFVVDIRTPPAHVKLDGLPHEVAVEANVTMMCGCPITPGGLWDANQFEVGVLLARNGERVGEFPLSYAGTSSQFGGALQVDEPGVYRMTVFAYDPANGNTGLDETTFIVSH
ncbi:MAG: hypothetical protein GWN84_11800 [Gammaproteobacteria bacterium]|nr:hypothetical protein [Gammaproteobacteria bacterium]NIR83551.1 hypothetical protein [Gammaproteobacteria bacterium]NIR91473.1 hypothetical protein [Gammaproteobacteria bacterium]NIU04713.1 hypothetical protein [Gammaproteobacteria bacterium]NIV51755.1 hypothetical protein [Gammaproteobacteria bacterium]